MNNSTTLFLFIDGIRWDYIDRMPYLKSLSKKGLYVKQLKPVSGFQQDIPMFAGLYTRESNVWFSLKFDKEKSSYKYLERPFYKLMGCLYKLRKVMPTKKLKNIYHSIIMSKIIKAGGYKYMNFPRLMPNCPLDMMPFFDVTSNRDRQSWLPAAFNKFETIFDICFIEKKKVNYCAAPVFSRPLNIMMDRITEDLDKHFDLSIYQITDLDHKVHDMGPESSQLDSLLSYVDKGIQEIHQLFSEKYSNLNVLICGDHGMTQVKKKVNAQKELLDLAKNSNLILKKDYVYILDSTHLRVRYLNDKGKNLEKLFWSSSFFKDNGIIIDSAMRELYNLPDNNEYGDFIWEVNFGSIIQPNFYNDSAGHDINGMHGYLPLSSDINSTAIVLKNNINSYTEKEIGEMIDICPTICDLMKIPLPDRCQGKSLVI